jgi:hypothetical protein
MQKTLGLLLSVKFGSAILLFLLPFVTVSCGNMVNVPLTGMNLAVGTSLEMKEPFSGKIKKEKVEMEPLATLALIAAVIGAIFGFVNAMPARILNLLSGIAGIFFLLLLKAKLDKEVLKESSGMVVLHYEAVFWIVMLLFLLAAVVSIYAVISSNRSKIE